MGLNNAREKGTKKQEMNDHFLFRWKWWEPRGKSDRGTRLRCARNLPTPLELGWSISIWLSRIPARSMEVLNKIRSEVKYSPSSVRKSSPSNFKFNFSIFFVFCHNILGSVQWTKCEVKTEEPGCAVTSHCLANHEI